MKYYAGIGAREIPEDVHNELVSIGLRLAQNGWTLRSGGAQGADSAFEFGNDCCSSPPPSKEIFLPWKGFNNNISPLYFHSIPPELESIAKKIYLGWDNVSIGVKKLHARNVQQILGENPGTSEPSQFVVCWTLRPVTQFGGTRVGMKLAELNGIPVYNLAIEEEKEKFYEEIFQKEQHGKK